MNTKNLNKVSGLAAFLAILSSGISTLNAAGVYTPAENLVINRFFEGGDYTGWSTGGAWRDNGGNNNLVFDFLTTGSAGGFDAATASIQNGGLRDISSVDSGLNYTDDVDFDIDTAMLSSLTFESPFIGHAAGENRGANLNANFFVEFDIQTSGGNYRARSQDRLIDDSTSVIGGDFAPVMTWQIGGGFLGDPFADGSGVTLSSITGIEYKWFINTVAPNSDGSGTYFFTVDNAGLRYEVTVVPEPGQSSVIMGAIAVLFAFLSRCRFRRT